MALPVNFLTLHREPTRPGYFLAHQTASPHFDGASKSWIVSNPVHCRDLIASGNLRPATYGQDYEALRQRLGIDFSSLTFAFSHIPLCLDGEEHGHARLQASAFLATRKRALNARIPEAIDKHLGPFRHEGRIEVMKDTVLPLVLDIISTVIDIDLNGVDCLNASIVFDRSIGIGRRNKLEAEIANLRALIASRLGAGASEEDIGLRLALLILGKDALVGTLGESLHRLLEAHSGKRLSDIAYPELPPETGVPFIERLVVTPFILEGSDFAAGDRVRIFLQSLAYAPEARTRTAFFGAGAHACLGRPVSLDIWRALTSSLSHIPLRASLMSYAPRTSDYVFACPAELAVDLSR